MGVARGGGYGFVKLFLQTHRRNPGEIVKMDTVVQEVYGGILTIKSNHMENIADDWEPFRIQVTIEGKVKSLLIIPDREKPQYAVFDQHVPLGTIWQDSGKSGKIWCGEGVVVRALLTQLGEQIDDYLLNKPI